MKTEENSEIDIHQGGSPVVFDNKKDIHLGAFKTNSCFMFILFPVTLEMTYFKFTLYQDHFKFSENNFE